MTSISKEYLLLFNAVTNTERSLAQLREALLEAQRQAEELFLEEPGEDAPQPGPARLYLVPAPHRPNGNETPRPGPASM